MGMLMPAKIDLIGITRNRLTAISEEYRNGKWYLHCTCSCGGSTVVAKGQFNSGSTKSCGCLQKERASAANFKHGKSRLYKHGDIKNDIDGSYGVWQDIHKRCSNPKFKDWKYYGGKGIKVCPEWDDYLVFSKDMGVRPAGYTIERKDGNLGYSADNCYWATQSANALNRSGHSLWKPVRINGIDYPSMMRAEAALGLSVYKLKKLNELKNETPNKI